LHGNQGMVAIMVALRPNRFAGPFLESGKSLNDLGRTRAIIRDRDHILRGQRRDCQEESRSRWRTYGGTFQNRDLLLGKSGAKLTTLMGRTRRPLRGMGKPEGLLLPLSHRTNCPGFRPFVHRSRIFNDDRCL
jgi:hypothetical protein